MMPHDLWRRFGPRRRGEEGEGQSDDAEGAAARRPEREARAGRSKPAPPHEQARLCDRTGATRAATCIARCALLSCGAGLDAAATAAETRMALIACMLSELAAVRVRCELRSA